MLNNKISSEYNRVIVAELAKTYLVSKEYTERPECDVVSQDTLMIKRRIRYYIENVIFNILDDSLKGVSDTTIPFTVVSIYSPIDFHIIH